MSTPTLFDQPHDQEKPEVFLVECANRSHPQKGDPIIFPDGTRGVITDMTEGSEITVRVPCPTATQLRDAGISSVTRNEQSWLEAAHELIARYPTNEANAEELRDFVDERIGGPAHHNSWGGLFIGAVRKGLLKNLGIYVKSSRPASHARRVPVYFINK